MCGQIEKRKISKLYNHDVIIDWSGRVVGTLNNSRRSIMTGDGFLRSRVYCSPPPPRHRRRISRVPHYPPFPCRVMFFHHPRPKQNHSSRCPTPPPFLLSVVISNCTPGSFPNCIGAYHFVKPHEYKMFAGGIILSARSDIAPSPRRKTRLRMPTVRLSSHEVRLQLTCNCY